MTHAERRRQERHNVWVKAVVQTSDITVPAIATEISGDGLRIQCQKQMGPGTKVRIDLQLDEKVAIVGEIVWALNILVDTLNVYDMGIKTDIVYYEDIKVNKFSTRAEAVQRIVERFK